MKFIILFSLFLIIASAEILEPVSQKLNIETLPSTPEETLNDAPLTRNTMEEQPLSPLLSAPAELPDKRTRQQRNVLLKTEIPTVVVPTYEVPQFYILVDQPRYAPWYYYPNLPMKEMPEKQEQQ